MRSPAFDGAASGIVPLDGASRLSPFYRLCIFVDPDLFVRQLSRGLLVDQPFWLTTSSEISTSLMFCGPPYIRSSMDLSIIARKPRARDFRSSASRAIRVPRPARAPESNHRRRSLVRHLKLDPQSAVERQLKRPILSLTHRLSQRILATMPDSNGDAAFRYDGRTKMRCHSKAFRTFLLGVDLEIASFSGCSCR
jgi:hypothetical protein